ncbi:ABC transporter permease [Phytoactinopolyspora halotolerans]|nr:ABC transporter permease [Phytoactinopolyspora halotolerans]
MIARRLLLGVFVMWGCVTLIFVIVRLAPGDQATLSLGPDATADEIEAARERFGVNDPLLLQYVSYIGRALRFDFGDSYRLGQPAMEAVLDRFPATIQLALSAMAIAVVVGLILGCVAGGRPNGLVDRVVSGVSISLQSFPTFWVGIMLILLFALNLRVLPSAGSGSLSHLVLPAVTLSLPQVAIVARLTRSSLAESMQDAYVQTARSKGLTEPQVLLGHVLKNSLIPVVTIIGLQTGVLLGGSVVVENVFAWPGLGSLIVDSVSARDYSVVQAAALLIAAVVVVLNLLADLTYARLDPRIRVEAKA